MADSPRTDPTGLSFLSYRRSRLPEAEVLLRAQHEVGIPTWQDVEDLDEGHTDTQLRQVLSDPFTANAVLWLTPEVADSPTILRTEVPGVLGREQAGDGFFFVPVAAGSLDFQAASDLVSAEVGIHDLSTWNMRRVTHDLATEEDIRTIARHVLRRRIDAVHRALPGGQALRIRFMTRHKPAAEPGWALSLDWSHRFDLRSARDGAWETLLPALVTVREAVRAKAPGRPLEACGAATLSAGLALGRAFLSLDGTLSLTWRQEAPDRPDQLWSLATAREDADVEITRSLLRTDGDALAVVLSITSDAMPALGRSKAELPPFRAAIDVRRKGESFRPFIIETPGQAVEIVERTIEAVRRAVEELGTSSLHLFGAIPIGLAVLLGQRLNTLGPVQIYEHTEGGASAPYRPGVLLRPESF